MIKMIGKSVNSFSRGPYPKNLFDFRKFIKTRFSEKVSKFDFFSFFAIRYLRASKKIA